MQPRQCLWLAVVYLIYGVSVTSGASLPLSVQIAPDDNQRPAANGAPTDTARQDVANTATTVTVQKLQSRPDPWRVQVRSQAASMDSSKAYTWRCMARASSHRRVSINIVDVGSQKPVADLEVPLTPNWQTISFQSFQPSNPGMFQVQVYLGNALGTFSFRSSTLSSSTLDRSSLSSSAVADRIRQNRQGTFYVSVGDSNDADVPVRGLNLTLARHGFIFGTAIAPEVVQQDTPGMYDWYRSTITNNFWSVTPENLFKWNKYEPGAPGDTAAAARVLQQQYIAFAQQNKMDMVRGHTLEWGESYKMCLDGKRPCHWSVRGFDCEAYKQALRTRVMRDVAQWRGKFTQYDVLNEPVGTPSMLSRCNLWNTTARDVFTWARSQDPNAELCVNEWAPLETQNWQGLFNLVTSLKAAGVPVTCIGVQAHLTVNKASQELMWWRLNQLSSLGLPLYITEFSLNSRWDSGAGRYTSEGIQEADQASRMEQLVRQWFSHPAVKGITMWGFWDGNIWSINGGIFRTDGTPKPAALALQRLWRQQWNTTIVNAVLPLRAGAADPLAASNSAITNGLNSITNGNNVANGRRHQRRRLAQFDNSQPCFEQGSWGLFGNYFNSPFRPCGSPAADGPPPSTPAPAPAPAPIPPPAPRPAPINTAPNVNAPTPTKGTIIYSPSGSPVLRFPGYYGRYRYEFWAGDTKYSGELDWRQGKSNSVRLRIPTSVGKR